MTSPISQLVSGEELSGPSDVSVRLNAFELFTALQAAEIVCAWACAPIAAVRPPPIPRQRMRRATTRHEAPMAGLQHLSTPSYCRPHVS